jgi:hypothetical protein
MSSQKCYYQTHIKKQKGENMKKIISLIGIVIVAFGAFVLMNSKDNYDASKYFAKYDGKTIEFKLPDQFDKTHEVTNDTKLLVMAFLKEDGHTIREYLKSHRPTLLEENHAMFLADISKVPVVIRNMVILKDFKKSKFPVVIIYDKKISQTLNDNKEKILVMHLKNKKIVKTENIKTTEELDKLFKK